VSEPLKERVEVLYAFLEQDANGNEGILAFPYRVGYPPVMPLDPERMENLRLMAQQIARVRGRAVLICRFSVREELEVIEP
jgi:hypothetical protein